MFAFTEYSRFTYSCSFVLRWAFRMFLWLHGSYACQQQIPALWLPNNYCYTSTHWLCISKVPAGTCLSPNSLVASGPCVLDLSRVGFWLCHHLDWRFCFQCPCSACWCFPQAAGVYGNVQAARTDDQQATELVNGELLVAFEQLSVSTGSVNSSLLSTRLYLSIILG